MLNSIRFFFVLRIRNFDWRRPKINYSFGQMVLPF